MPAFVLILFVAAEAALKIYSPSYLQPFAVVLFALCVAYFFYYFRRHPRGIAMWEDFLSLKSSWKWNTVIVAAIVLLGCFLRFWKLGSLFDGMTYDESYKGLDAIAIREFGERPIFLNWNGGRESLVAYLVAAAQMFFDYTSLSVRVVTAIAGCVSILFFYLFTRTLFSNRIALLSTFLLAVSKWHIIHSRYGVRAGLYPAFELGALYLLSRGLQSEKKRVGYLIAAGVIGGLGLYTYIAYRIFPFVVLAFLAEKIIRKNLSRHVKAVLAAAIVCVAIVAPLAKFYLENMDSLTDRMKRTQVWRQTDRTKEGPVELVLDSAMRSFGMFTYRGDPIARHNIQEEPMLSPFVSAFFILGVLVVLINWRKPYAVFLLLYFLLTLLPGILSVGAPNVPRVFGCLPVVFLFTSFGILAAAQIVSSYFNDLPRLLIAVVLAGCLLTGSMDSLVRQPAMLDSLTPRVAALWGMDRDQANVARLASQLGNRCDLYLSPAFFFHSTVEYLTYSKVEHKLITPQSEFKKIFSDDRIILVVFQPHEINPWWLRDDAGKDFYKWWRQVYGMETQDIRKTVRRSYDPPLTKTSDWRLFEVLRKKYPMAKVVHFEHFSLFLLKPG